MRGGERCDNVNAFFYSRIKFPTIKNNIFPSFSFFVSLALSLSSSRILFAVGKIGSGFFVLGGGEEYL